MNILDCVTYFDEEIILKLRLNILYDHVTKFIITEGEYDHRGNKRKLNFDIKKYDKFNLELIIEQNTQKKNGYNNRFCWIYWLSHFQAFTD